MQSRMDSDSIPWASPLRYLYYCLASSSVFWETGIRKFRLARSGPSHVAEDDLRLQIFLPGLPSARVLVRHEHTWLNLLLL